MKVGSFGDVVFEASAELVRTPESVTRTRKARYAEHKVLGAKPRLEFLAPELAALSMKIRLHAACGVDPVREADRLAALCEEGKAERLMLSGENLGTFVLESVSEVQKKAGPDGRIAFSELTLSFKEYV